MPGRKWAASNYRYSFNGKEKSSEINESNFDFDARILDSRIAQWLSPDPHRSNTPGISPYAFAYNNPIAFKDHDGKDGRIAFVPNADGCGGKIIIETVIHLFGPDAKKDVAKHMNENFGKVLGSVGEFVDIAGEKWTIEFNLTYSADNIEKLNDCMLDIINASNWISLDATSEAIKFKELQDQIKDIKAGDNLLFLGPTSSDSGGNTIMDWLSMSRANQFGTMIHEIFHLMGIMHTTSNGQKYADYSDIMKPITSDEESNNINRLIIHPATYVNFIELTKKLFNTSSESGTKVFKKPENFENNNKAKVNKAENNPHKVERKHGGSSNGKPRYTGKGTHFGKMKGKSGGGKTGTKK